MHKVLKLREIISITKTLIGYLVRPKLYPELARKFYKNIFNRSNALKGQEISKEWCGKYAISERDAIIKLTKSSTQSIYIEYKTELEAAKKAETECPVMMGGAGALDLFYSLSEFTQAKNILETGVAYGWSSLAALLSLQKREGTLYSSDMPYLDRNNDKFVGVVVPESLRKYWKLFRFADKESIPKILNEQKSFQIIHYDSDKSYDGRMWAYKELWPCLDNNGFFISDDIEDNSAFKDWCETNNYNPIIVKFEGKYVGVVKK